MNISRAVHASALPYSCLLSVIIALHPYSLADLTDNRRRNHKTTLTTPTALTVFLYDIMQLAAFLCVICVICGRIHARVLNLSAQKKPLCLPQISLIYADKPQNHTNRTASRTCLSLRNNAACCIPLRNLRDLRENNHVRVLNQSARKQNQAPHKR